MTSSLVHACIWRASDLFYYLQWGLGDPQVIFSVTGGAVLDLTPRQHRVFLDGLAHAATTVKSVVVTGGSNAGVMKLTGAALADRGVKLIGVASTCALCCVLARFVASWKHLRLH